MFIGPAVGWETVIDVYAMADFFYAERSPNNSQARPCPTADSLYNPIASKS
jgi:hypothetical protein